MIAVGVSGMTSAEQAQLVAEFLGDQIAAIEARGLAPGDVTAGMLGATVLRLLQRESTGDVCDWLRSIADNLDPNGCAGRA